MKKLFLNGQSLVEIIVVVAMASTVLIALVAFGNLGLRNTAQSELRSDAIKLTTSGIEAIRYVRDAKAAGCGFDALFDNTTKNDRCYSVVNNCTAASCVCNSLDDLQLHAPAATCDQTDGNSWVQIAIPNKQTYFRRFIKIEGVDTPHDPDTNPDDNIFKATVIVEWDEAGGTREVTLNSVLSKNK